MKKAGFHWYETIGMSVLDSKPLIKWDLTGLTAEQKEKLLQALKDAGLLDMEVSTYK